MAVTSKHLMGTSELTLIAEIRPGLIPIAEPMTYATRLRSVLKVLFEIRKLGVERDSLVGGAGPLESLRSLHHIHWSIHDDDRKLLLAVSFDGPWEAYIRDIVEKGGPILDIIFSHCSGYVGSSCFDGYPEFSEWVRARQINCDFFYAGTPNLTVDDARYLQDFEQAYARLGHLPAPEKSEENPTPTCPFHASVPGLHVGPPTIKGSTDQLLARQRNLLAARDRLAPLFPNNDERNSSNDELIFRRAIQLLGSFIDPRASAPKALPKLEPVALTESDVAAIQGNILTGYRQVSRGRFLLVRLPDDPESRTNALDHLAAIVTTERSAVESAVTHNVAFTFSGLANLGLSPELLSKFPKEFQEGMAARAGVLGDVGAHHPEKWDLPTYRDAGQAGVSGVERVELSTVDLVVVLQAPNESEERARELLDVAVASLEQHELVVLNEQSLERTLIPGQGLVREHFGFFDGYSQPVPQIENRAPGIERDRVPLGEILLGYENQRGETGPQPFELFKNSSFLVVRKLEQRVRAFEEAAHTGRTESEAERIMALMMGRTRDGQPLVKPEAIATNDFDYSQDQSGEKCPFFAHVRRANPRTTQTVYARADRERPDATHVALGTPRILRRGFGYRSGDEVGVMFMAFNSSIADQYEVIQRWVNGANSTGVSSAHPDLIAGNFPRGAERALSVRRGSGVETIQVPQEPFAKLKWGLYLFAPSKSGLQYLADASRGVLGAAVSGVMAAELVTRGKQIASALAALEREKPGQSFVEWKKILEDNDLRPYARAVWAYVRSRGGSLKTPYGVLVGSEWGVNEVLSNEAVYSVREYHRRMEATFGGHYLGMDRHPKPLPSAPEYPVEEGQYDRESVVANRWLMGIGIVDSFEHARALTRRYCNDQRSVAAASRLAAEERGEPVPKQPAQVRIDIQQLGRIVVAGVAEGVFGLPDNTLMTAGPDLPDQQPPARCPGDFQRVSQFIFHPNPTTTLTEVARARGAVVERAVDDYVRAVLASEYDELPDWLTLPDATTTRQAEHAKKTLIGSINGFVVPTSASFTSILVQWIESKELWRWQAWLGLAENTYLRDSGARLDAPSLETSLLLVAAERAMMRAPVPDLLHRTAVARSLIGSEPVEPGDRVVVSLGSATAERGKAALLFGGARDPGLAPERQKPLHACPGRAMAEGVILGMLVGLLSEPSLRRADRVTVEIEPEVPVEPEQLAQAK